MESKDWKNSEAKSTIDEKKSCTSWDAPED